MSAFVAYEVRIHTDDGWRIEAIFDEKALAVDSAKRLQGRKNKLPIMVVEETYDPDRDKVTDKVVFRGDFFGGPIKVIGGRRSKNTDTGQPDEKISISQADRSMDPVFKKLLMFIALFAAMSAYVALKYYD